MRQGDSEVSENVVEIALAIGVLLDDRKMMSGEDLGATLRRELSEDEVSGTDIWAGINYAVKEGLAIRSFEDQKLMYRGTE